MKASVVARVAWLVPLALLLLAAQQGKAALDLHETLVRGERARAAVTRYMRSDRKDVTHAEVDLVVTLSDGSSITRERLALPYSIAHRVEAESVDVRVLRGAAQEIVIESIGQTQRRIAAIDAAIAAVACLMALAGVVAWNRNLRRETT